MINLLLLNFPVMLFAVTISRLYFRFSGLIDNIISYAVFYFAFIIISEELLGIFGILTLNTLLIINLFLLTFSFLLIQKKEFGPGSGLQIKSIINKCSCNKFIFFCAAVILGFSLVKLTFNLYNPPFGWDSLNYHLTFAVEWLKHKNLDTPLVIADNPCPSYYPLNGSLIYLWYIFPFKNVFLADLGQTPFFVLVLLAVYNICRKFNVSRECSFFAAALMTVTPNYFKQLSISYVDVMVCAWFLISLNFLLNLFKKLDLKNVVVCSIALGMLIGTKTIALLYSFILLVFFVIFLVKKKFNLFSIYLLVTFLCCVVVTGGFGYIRNFIQTGNPLYPLTLKIFDKVIFNGVMDKLNFTVFSNPEDYSVANIIFREGMGAGTTMFVIPGLALFIFRLFKARKLSLYDAILIGPFLFLYLVYRYAFALPNARYLYPALALGYIICFYILHNIKFSLKKLRWFIVICVLASMPEMARHLELIISLSISFVLFIILAIGYHLLQKHFFKISLITISALIFILGIANIDYNKYEFRRYTKTVKYSGFWIDATKAWEWLNQNTNANIIAYAGRPVPFPLYGANLKNDVYYVSVNITEPAKLHYFPGSHYQWGYDFLSLHNNLEAKGNYRADANYSIWLGNLSRRNIDYLFIYSLHQTRDIIFPLEDRWAKANPGKFNCVFANETIRIYKILK